MAPILKVRSYTCDDCGTVHQIQTNHESNVFHRCINWCCHRPAKLQSMSFFQGEAEVIESEFYDSTAQTKVKIPVNPQQYQAWLDKR